MPTLLQKLKFLRGALTGGRAYAGPFYVTVDLTRRCNLHCLGCRFHSLRVNVPSIVDRNVQDIPFELFERLCHEIKTTDAEALILIAEGEPFLHPRIFDIISTAKNTGVHVTLVTNGTLLDKDTVHSPLITRLDRIQVSLWTGSPEGYEQNYPGTAPDNFEKVVRGLMLLRSRKAERQSKLPYVILHHPLHRHNFQEIDTFVDLALRTGCDAVSFSPFYTHREELNSHSLNPDDEKFLFQSLKQTKKWLRRLPLNHNIDQTLLRYGIGEAVWKKLPCYIGWIDARVKMDGTVVPCNPCCLPMGNLGQNSLREIWNGPAYRDFRRRTWTRQGLAALGEQCDCQYCCHVPANMRLHRVLKWVSPFIPQPERGASCPAR